MSTPTPTPSISVTPSLTASNTPTNTATGTSCPTPTQTPSQTQTPSTTPTLTATLTNTPTQSPTQTQTQTPSQTQTQTPTNTPTQSPTQTQTPTNTQTQTQTPTNTQTQTGTPTQTPSPTLTQTPSSTPDFSCLRAWYDCSDLSSLTYDVNGKVSQWNDKGPNGYNLTQSNSSFQPVLTAQTLNPQVNFSAVTFNGVNQFMSISGISFTDTGFTYLVAGGISRNEIEGYVFSMDGPTSQPALEANYFLFGNDQGSGTDRVWLGSDNTNYFWNLTSNSATTLDRSSGLYFGVVSGTTTAPLGARMNDQSASGTLTKTVSNTVTSIAFGAESGSTPTTYALSQMMELRVFNCVLTNAQLQYHINEMKSKWLYSQWLVTPTPTESPTQTPTNTQTPSNSPTQTPTLTRTPSQTPTNTQTPSNSPTQTPTNTQTQTQTPTNTTTLTSTPTQTPSNSPTQTQTPSNSPTPSITPSQTVTPTQSPTQTITPSITSSPTPTPTTVYYTRRFQSYDSVTCTTVGSPITFNFTTAQLGSLVTNQYYCLGTTSPGSVYQYLGTTSFDPSRPNPTIYSGPHTSCGSAPC